MRWSPSVAVPIVLGLAITIGCSAAGGPPPTAPPGGAVITANGLTFDRQELDVPAGRPFSLLFENREIAPHNVAIFAEGSATALFAGEIFSGEASRIYEVPSLAAGTYRFRCDVHPEMSGTLISS
jgi:plastocyanin